MQEPLMKAGIASLRISDHTVHSVSAFNETESQKRKAYRDLEEALPDAEACDEVGATIRSIVTTPDFHPGKPVPVGVVAECDETETLRQVGGISRPPQWQGEDLFGIVATLMGTDCPYPSGPSQLIARRRNPRRHPGRRRRYCHSGACCACRFPGRHCSSSVRALGRHRD